MRPLPLSSFPRARGRGFTLIEMLAAAAVLVVLLGIIIAVTNSVSTTVRRASSNVDAMATARAGFDIVNRTLSRATLNTYWEYDDPLSPSVYLRQSDLQFLIQQNTQQSGYGQELFFVTPETYAESPSLSSTRGLLNACGFYVQFANSADFRPDSITGDRYRYRLMYGLQPTENLEIFARPEKTAGQSTSAYRAELAGYWQQKKWVDILKNGGNTSIPDNVSPLADNIIAFVAWPRLSTSEDDAGNVLSGDYQYDSQENAFQIPQPLTANQLPPVIQVTMIAISEASAARVEDGSTPPAVIEQALQGRFTSVDRYKKDLEDVSSELTKANIEHQVFTTAIPLRESKWSRAQ